MRLFRHWKMIIGLMAIFAAGVGTGAVGVVAIIVRTISKPVSTQRWVDSRMSEFSRKLQLTEEQELKIRPIVQTAAQRFQSIGGETFQQIIATAEQAHADVSKELTPEQQVEFNKMRRQVINALRDLSQREITVRGAGRHGAAPKRPEAETPADAEP